MKSKYQLLGRCGIFCGTDCEVYQAAHSCDIEEKKSDKSSGARIRD